MHRQLIPRPTQRKIRFNLQNIPERCTHELLEVIKKRIEFSTIKKANKQVRETKKFLNAPNAKGLLILVNDGNLTVEPDLMAHLLARILKGKYSNLHAVIYFSANVFASIPSVVQPALFWIDALVPDRTPVSKDFRQRLQEQWFSHYSSLIKNPIYEIMMPNNPELVEQIQLK